MAAGLRARLGRVGALALLSWSFLAVVDALVMFAMSQSAVRRAMLPRPDRLSLACFELVSLAVLSAPFALLVGAARWLVGRGRRAAMIASALATWLMLLFAATSWAGLALEDMFLDAEGLRGWIPNPGMIFKWVNPAIILCLPIAAALLATVALRVIPAEIERAPRRWLVRRSLGALAALALMTLGFALGYRAPRQADEFDDNENGTASYSRAANYAEAMHASAGAFAHALLDLKGLASPDTDVPALSGDVEVVHPPAMAMRDYLAASPAREPALNVVLIMIESLRADRLAAWGETRALMPAVDAFAAGALRFRHTYTVAPQTNYAAPAAVSGQYPLRSSRIYIYPDVTAFPRVMLYDVLKARGYRVGLFSSQDEHWGRMDNFLRTPSVDTFFQPPTLLADPKAFAEAIARAGLADTEAHHGAQCLDDSITVGEALRWIDASGATPFFLSLNLQSSHYPYALPSRARHRFGPAKVDFPTPYASYPPEHAPEMMGMYDDALSYADEQVATFFAGLDARGLGEQTIVVVTSDHGESFNEHGELCHANSLFEEAVRIPLMVRAPGVAARQVDAPAQLIDVPPTVAGLLGLPVHPAWQGLDLLGTVPPERDLYFVVHTPMAHQYGVVEGREKLVLDVDARQLMLFDVAEDAAEQHNLVHARPERAKALRLRLDSWRAAQLAYYRDPLKLLVSNPPRLVLRPR